LQQLDVDPDNVSFLRLQDGRLLEHVDQAVERVIQVLIEHPAQQVFIPYYQDRDPGLDHVATNQIVLSALKKLGRRTTVYEYPIWYWRWWPQTRLPVRGELGVWTARPHSVLPNLRSLRDFNAYVKIQDLLDGKRMALKQHRSQLQGLDDIQRGAFVRWFFGRRELFHRHICA
jgi:LmbE family N-acetylglucosaminyl deacetylase